MNIRFCPNRGRGVGGCLVVCYWSDTAFGRPVNRWSAGIACETAVKAFSGQLSRAACYRAVAKGSVSPRAYLAELPSLVAEITAGTIAVTATTMLLADVRADLALARGSGERTVLVP